VGISFSNLTEAIEATVHGMGFVSDTHGRFKYFRGTLKISDIPTIYQLGARPNAFVPVGVADLEGAEAFFISSRVIAAIKTGFPSEFTTSILHTDEESLLVRNTEPIGSPYRLPAMEDIHIATKPVAYDLEDRERLSTLKSAKNLKKTFPKVKVGIFLPYFTGLVLPDKDFVPDLLTTQFSSLLGNNQAEIAQASQTLWSGWSTLASTAVGLQLQHQAYCLKLALATGCKIITFIPGGSYQGTILANGPPELTLHKRGKSYTPIGVDELQQELAKWDSQDELLAELAESLNTIPLLAEDPKVEGNTLSLTAASFTSARFIHNILRGLKFNEDDKVKTRAILKKLHFETKYLDPRAPEALERVFRIAKSGDFLADGEPMSVLDDAMFSRDPVTSAFASFGATAPSFYDEQGTALPILRRTKTAVREFGSYEVSKRKNHQGELLLPKGQIPVFIKSSQLAASDFKQMQRTNALRFRKTARGGVQGCAYTISSEYVPRIETMLHDVFAPEKSTSRKRKDLADEFSAIDLNQAAARATKRQKRGEAAGSLWALAED
jgi:hypothetical protein